MSVERSISVYEGDCTVCVCCHRVLFCADAVDHGVYYVSVRRVGGVVSFKNWYVVCAVHPRLGSGRRRKEVKS